MRDESNRVDAQRALSTRPHRLVIDTSNITVEGKEIVAASGQTVGMNITLKDALNQLVPIDPLVHISNAGVVSPG